MSNKNKRNELHEKQLESLAKQLEGEVDSRLPQRRFRLSVFAPYVEGVTIHYGELNGDGTRYYLVPDVRSAILILHILWCEYKLLGIPDIGWILFELEYWNEATGEWFIWYDDEGNDFSSYVLDENFVPHLPGDDDDDEDD